MKKLYYVTISIDVPVVAEDPCEAQDVAQAAFHRGEVEFIDPDLTAVVIHPYNGFKRCPEAFSTGLPFGGDGQKTCQEYFKEAAEKDLK